MFGTDRGPTSSKHGLDVVLISNSLCHDRQEEDEEIRRRTQRASRETEQRAKRDHCMLASVTYIPSNLLYTHIRTKEDYKQTNKQTRINVSDTYFKPSLLNMVL